MSAYVLHHGWNRSGALDVGAWVIKADRLQSRGLNNSVGPYTCLVSVSSECNYRGLRAVDRSEHVSNMLELTLCRSVGGCDHSYLV